eukprot:TRINITY_DN30406_c0_g2_i1.p1 TRINITY_DN30406_c0_g2~~TRINITY_DN30406_c0_g2_i1.p1  ORF type:complete len:651 (+),score=123.65 TRINITY_DN30406_c0_g2_i1:158-2110(+)
MSKLGITNPNFRRTLSLGALLDANGINGISGEARPKAVGGGLEKGSITKEFEEAMAESSRHNEVMRKVSSFQMANPHFRLNRADHVEDWGYLRIAAWTIVTNARFELFSSTLVLANIAIMVIETDTRAKLRLETDDELDIEMPLWLLTMSTGFLVLFTAELLLRIFALRRRFKGYFDYMDVVVILTDWTCFILRESMRGGVPAATSLRALRVLRTVRVGRAIRSMKIFRELYVMLHGFFSTLKAVFWASILLFLILTIWGIVAVEVLDEKARTAADEGLFGECERCGRSFADVWTAEVTFIQQLVAGDSWGLVTIPMLERFPSTAPLFMAILLTVEVGLMNLILSVVVDTASDVHQQDAGFMMQQRRERMEAAQEQFMLICRELDGDDSGCVSVTELLNGYDTLIELRDAMDQMDISRDEIVALFRLLDEDSSGTVSYSEFAEKLTKMKMTDMSMLLVFLKSNVKELEQKIFNKIASIEEGHQRQEQAIVELNARIFGKAKQTPQELKVTLESSLAPSGDGTLADAYTSFLAPPELEEKLIGEKKDLHPNFALALENLRERVTLGLAAGRLPEPSVQRFWTQVDAELRELTSRAVEVPRCGTCHQPLQTSSSSARTPESFRDAGDAWSDVGRGSAPSGNQKGTFDVISRV